MDTTTPTPSALDVITIASPCTVDWDTMTGDERSRHCGECRLDVYDLSAMTRVEAETFLAKRKPGARLCVRFQRRPDGRIVTDDCLTARERISRRARRVRVAAAALLALVFPALSACSDRSGSGSPVMPAPVSEESKIPVGEESPPRPAHPEHITGIAAEMPESPPVPQNEELKHIQGDVCDPAPVPPAKDPEPEHPESKGKI